MIDLLKRIFKKRGVDRTLYACVFILTIFGIVMIGSASIGETASKGATYATVNMIKQAVFVGAGYIFMIFFARCFKTKWIQLTSTWIIYFIGILSLFVCLLWYSKGSYAWIKLGPITIQPAEFMKLIMILFLSFHFGEIEELCAIPKSISQKDHDTLVIRKFWYCVLRPIIAIIFVFLIVGFIQKDLGSAIILAFICMMLFFITPRPYYSKYKKMSLVLLVIFGVVALVGMFFILKPYQLGRIYTWLNPLEDPMKNGWQLTNALIAFTKGGLFGRGFGASTQKYGYIPESHNDFIAAIIYGTRIEQTKSKLILYGIGILFFTHLLINVGGVSGFIPMTGVPLLLISSGGSSTLMAMISLGIAQSIISKYNRQLLKEQIS